VLVLVACAGGGDDADPATRSSTSTSVTTESTAVAPTVPNLPVPDTTPVVLEAPVEQLVLTQADIDQILPGFTHVDDGTFVGTGPLDLATAASAEVDAQKESDRLESFGFDAGYGTAFEADDGRVATCSVYRFRDASAAGFYLLDGAERLLARAATPFDVTEPTGAFGFTQIDETVAGSFVGHGVVFTVGEHFFVCVVGGPGSSTTPDDVRAVARAQASRARSFAR
jgi:hypothetical protein